MTNAELIKALQCASHFALYQDCYEKNCYANSGKGLYCNIPKLIADAADALEAAEKRIADLETALAACRSRKGEQLPKEGEWIDGDARKVTARCSVCGHLRLGNGAKWANMYVPFCEICGAKMKGANDEQIH